MWPYPSAIPTLEVSTVGVGVALPSSILGRQSRARQAVPLRVFGYRQTRGTPQTAAEAPACVSAQSDQNANFLRQMAKGKER